MGDGLSCWYSHTQLRLQAAVAYVEAEGGCRYTYNGGVQGQQQRPGPTKNSLAAAGTLATSMVSNGCTLSSSTLLACWGSVLGVCVEGVQVHIWRGWLQVSMAVQASDTRQGLI